MSRTNKADAKGLFALVHDQLGQIAVIRQEARDKGWEMPEGVNQQVLKMRLTLLKAGLTPQQIDSTPGLEAPN
jgi:hypothetical protein